MTTRKPGLSLERHRRGGELVFIALVLVITVVAGVTVLDVMPR